VDIRNDGVWIVLESTLGVSFPSDHVSAQEIKETHSFPNVLLRLDSKDVLCRPHVVSWERWVSSSTLGLTNLRAHVNGQHVAHGLVTEPGDVTL